MIGYSCPAPSFRTLIGQSCSQDLPEDGSRSEKRTTQRANFRARHTAAITFTVRQKRNRSKVAFSAVEHSQACEASYTAFN
ncbi:uncharacterized [Tachysurus ichikawai]